uniref:Protein phosphatase 1, regulatory (inhibitor) subunit 14Bb n=1 Tax=Neolamprologus brichardi TaxID=32507 RepID=A0A3Q4GH76_NEOBR
NVDSGGWVVTCPETSPQPRVYFQTPAGTTEEPETPVRKQGRVTVKYDRKELRKRLNLEEWIIDQLTDLYDCEVKTPNNNRAVPPKHGYLYTFLHLEAATGKDCDVICFNQTEAIRTAVTHLYFL